MGKGIFISFEGTDGSGKSTLIRTLDALIRRQERRKTLITREPGGPKVAEKIREILVTEPMHPHTELLLYEAARIQHLEEKIRPALKKKLVVLCDRFADSTVAYQGEGRNVDKRAIEWLNSFAVAGCWPHLTIWLDVNPSKSLKRAVDPNRFEAEGLRFQKKVRTGFYKLWKREHKRAHRIFRIVVRNQAPRELAEEVLNEIKRRRLL